MKVINSIKGMTVAMVMIALTGCGVSSFTSEDKVAYGDGTLVGLPGDGRVDVTVKTYGIGDQTALEGKGFVVDETGQAVNVNDLQSIFYFGFNQSSVKPDDLKALHLHAKYLSENADARVRLEGHTDERGTREYNMALGERRGKAVEMFLGLSGTARAQAEVISYGEEKPFAIDVRGEESWGQNRRVEIKYEAF